MDEFGVLVESIGFKAQGRSVPMADLKNKSPVNIPRSAYNSSSTHRSFNGNGQHQNHGVFDDVFGGFTQDAKPSGVDGFDLDSIFKGSGNLGRSSSMYANDDIFGGMPAQQIASVDDLFGDFAGMGLGSNGSRRTSTETKKTDGGFGDLIPGFGESATRNRENTGKIQPPPSAGHSVKSANNSAGDPFIVLEQSSSEAYISGINSKPNGQGTRKGSVSSAVNDFDDFVMGGQWKNTNGQSDLFQKERVETATPDLDSIFYMGTRPTNTSAESAAVDPVFDSLFQDKRSSANEKRGPRVGKSSGSSATMQKASSLTNIVDDFSLFFGEAFPSSGIFQEVEGESEERRRARLNHHMRTQNRMAQALAEKNERDLQTQREQEERHRIAETQDENIKRWATGKEGNLRALLSSLQHVLWPECGWQPVSLTDLITSVSVKKVYHKATLCVHPDKVQQKGANVQQKYIAEKVFDLLKEAWNKFNAEELR